MNKSQKPLDGFESRLGRGGKRVYFYSGAWRSAEAIERLRQSERERYAASRDEDFVDARVLDDEVRAERIETLVAALAEGRTWEAAAGELGITRQALYDTVHGASETQRRRVERAPARFHHGRAKRFASKMLEGLSGSEIARSEEMTPEKWWRIHGEIRQSDPAALPTPEQWADAQSERRRVKREARARELVKLYAKHGSYAALAAATGRTENAVTVETWRLRKEFPGVFEKPERAAKAS